MRSKRNLIAALGAGLALLTGATAALAARAPELQGAGWTGDESYTLASLRGKAVVLYFFEEG